jgi:hypothetical protein
MAIKTKTKIGLSLFLGLLFCLTRRSNASELMSSADAMPAGSWAVHVYGSQAKTEPEVKISGVSSIQVPVNGGTSTIFSNSNATIKMDQDSASAVASVSFRPRDGLQYRVKVGQVRDFKLEFSSGSQTNTLESQSDGFVWGVGLRHNLTQGTMVSAAIAIDLSYTQTQVRLDRFQAGTLVTSADEKFRQDEFQAAVNVSKRWKNIEPYGGLKILRVVSSLRDQGTKERVSGTVDAVSPFAGIKLDVFDRESLFVEGSLVGEKAISAGFGLQF